MFSVVIGTIDRAKTFNSILCKFDGDVDVKQGRYNIDGKSIMGLFALNLMSPIIVSANGDEESLIEECREKNIL